MKGESGEEGKVEIFLGNISIMNKGRDADKLVIQGNISRMRLHMGNRTKLERRSGLVRIKSGNSCKALNTGHRAFS